MGSALQTTFNDSQPAAFIGQLDGNQLADKSTGRNHESSASIPFGTPVAWDPSGAESDLDVTIPANATDKLKGVVFRTDSYMPAFTDQFGTHGELGANGLAPGTIMDLARKGRIFVKNKTAVAPGDPVHISYAAGGGTYTGLGQWGNAAAGGSTINVSGRAQWDSTALADAGAWLVFDFTKNA